MLNKEQAEEFRMLADKWEEGKCRMKDWRTLMDFVNCLAAPEPIHAATATCATCNDNGMIGGPSYSQPDEGGEPCPDCCPMQSDQVQRPLYQAAFDKRHEFDVYPASFMTGQFNAFVAGWWAALRANLPTQGKEGA